MTDRLKVAHVDEFEGEDSRVITEVGGQEVAVFELRGEYYALANYCVHQAGPLCEGARTSRTDVGEDGWSWTRDTEEDCIMCPWHGWTFDITDGTAVKDDSYSVPTYDVEVDDGDVYVVQ